MWELRARYQQDFDDIVNLVWAVHHDQLIYPTKSHLIALHKYLTQVEAKRLNIFTLERDDIEQELSMVWVKAHKTFKSKEKKKTSLRDYLLQCSIFGMRTWYSREVSTSDRLTEPPHREENSSFSIDFKFVVHGTTFYPLSTLSAYDRYLIFLKFYLEKSILEIAYIVQKHRHTVAMRLEYVINQLRRSVNEAQNTRRSSKDGGHGHCARDPQAQSTDSRH